ncbi:MAG: RNA 2',3'-cyclic phosphodiesterase [Acidimicrobiales bacterium]
MMERLFVAVWPSEAVIAALTELRRKDRRGVRWVAPENWHMTLHFLGDTDVDAVAGRLDEITFDAADLRFGPGVDAFFERVLVVPVTGLDQVARVVASAVVDLGSAPAKKRFAGHLTVARIRRDAHLVDLIGQPFTAEQPLHEIALVRSRLAPAGAAYETVATWPARPVYASEDFGAEP